MKCEEKKPMEKSEPANYDENISTFNVSGQNNEENIIHQPPVGTDPRFIDSGFQHDFNQKSNVEPPPQQSFNRTYMPPEPDSNDSYCARLFRNRRQVISISAGKPESVFSVDKMF